MESAITSLRGPSPPLCSFVIIICLLSSWKVVNCLPDPLWKDCRGIQLHILCSWDPYPTLPSPLNLIAHIQPTHVTIQINFRQLKFLLTSGFAVWNNERVMIFKTPCLLLCTLFNVCHFISSIEYWILTIYLK